MLESLFDRFFPVNIGILLITAFHIEHLCGLFLSVWYSNCSVFSICWPFLTKQKQNFVWVLLKRLVHLSKVCCLQLHIITIPTRFCWWTCRKQKLVQVKHYSNGYLFWYQDFDRFGEYFVHYLMSILLICILTGGLH